MAVKGVIPKSKEEQLAAFTKLDALEPVADKAEIDALTAITTPDASDEATAVTLANATKAKVNAIIAALKA